MEDSNAIAVPIRYNLPEDELYALLDQVNGVYFTGGSTLQIDPETGK